MLINSKQISQQQQPAEKQVHKSGSRGASSQLQGAGSKALQQSVSPKTTNKIKQIQQQQANVYNQTILEVNSRSNSSFEMQKSSTPSIYKGVIGLGKTRDLRVLQVQSSQDQSVKLPQIQGQTINSRGVSSPQGIQGNDFISSHTANSQEKRKKSQDQQFSPKKYPNRQITLSNSSVNVIGLQQQFISPQKQQDISSLSQKSSMPKINPKRVVSVAYQGFDKYVSQPPSNHNLDIFEYHLSNNNDAAAMMGDGDYGQEIDDGKDDDDDFKDNYEAQFLDVLDINKDGAAYEDDGEDPEESDDEANSDSGCQIEEVLSDNDDNNALGAGKADSSNKNLTNKKGSNKLVKRDSIRSQVGSNLVKSGGGAKSVKRKSTTIKRKKTGSSKFEHGYREDAAERKTSSQTNSTLEDQKQENSGNAATTAEITKYIESSQGLEVAPVGKSTVTQQQLKEKFAYLQRPPNNIVTLIKSPFNKRPATVFFPYPSYLKRQRPYGNEDKLIKMTQEELKPYSSMGFKFNSSTHTYNSIVNSLKVAGFRLVAGGGWNVLWTGIIKPSKLKLMNQYQRINHFPGCWQLGRKDNLWRNLFKMKRTHGVDYNIAPTTYIFPEDYKRWQAEREIDNFKSMYIMKPAASSCGRGIRIIGKKQQVNKRSGYVVSKYVAKPHTLRGFKYDMRIYVLVTCYEPLKVYLFEEGLVRLATVQYSTGKSTLGQRFVHLTNFSVNKKGAAYVPNANLDSTDEEVFNSSKWCLKQLRHEFDRLGIDYTAVFERVKDVIIKTLISVEAHIVTNMKQTRHRNICFELYGFDILLDEKLKPWLLEVNVCPSLSSSSPLDKQIKTWLLSDILHIIGFQIYDRKKFDKEQEQKVKSRLLGFDQASKKITAKDSNALPLSNNNSPSKRVQSQQSHMSSSSPEKHNRKLAEFVEGLVEDDWNLLAEFEEEQLRRGHFTRIFPLATNTDYYSKFFECNRHVNTVLWQYLKLGQPINIIKNNFK